jgi:hypothetical protein
MNFSALEGGTFSAKKFISLNRVENSFSSQLNEPCFSIKQLTDLKFISFFSSCQLNCDDLIRMT